MGKPDAPDPAETAAAQTGTNVGTAISNAFLGNVNQVTPDGTLTYDKTGSYGWKDPYTGKTYDIPTFTATQTLSPEQQAVKAQQDKAKLNLGTLAADQSGFLTEYLGTPFDGSTEARLMELGRKRLDPLLAERRAAIEQDLMDRGIRPGSDAYAQAINSRMQGENDAFNQLLLTGRGQAFAEAQATRNQPINEITALMSGSQVSAPAYVPTSMPSIPTTDVAGLINDDYKARLGSWNDMMGGLFGLGKAAIMAPGSPAIMASDERVKDDITEIGETHDGQPLYSFRYKGDDKPQIGLMAQDVEKRDPGAVIEIGGVKHVDYNRALGGVFGTGA
jgi:hypothetical protein